MPVIDKKGLVAYRKDKNDLPYALICSLLNMGNSESIDRPKEK